MKEANTGEHNNWTNWAKSDAQAAEIALTINDEIVKKAFLKIGITKNNRLLYKAVDGKDLRLEVSSFCTHPTTHEPTVVCAEQDKDVARGHGSSLLLPLNLFKQQLKAGRIVLEE